MTSLPLPRILRRRGEPGYPTFLELFFDLVYIFLLSRLAAGLANDLTVRGAAQTAVLLAAGWWVWVLTAWLTDLFDPRLPIIQATVLTVMFGTLLMAIAVPRAFSGDGWLFVAAYFGIHLVRDAVLIPGTRVNPPIQARSVRVFFWFCVTATPWIVGVFLEGDARLAVWALAVAVDLGSARLGWPTPRLGRTQLASQIFTGTHLYERHRAIFIIALGELVLAAGRGLALGEIGADRMAASALGFVGAVLLFLLYFQHVRRLVAPAVMVVERVRSGTSTSYTHLVMVAGVLAMSAGVSLVTGRVSAPTPVGWAVLILGGPALFLLGSTMFHIVVTGRLPWTRTAGVLLLAALVPAAVALPPLGAQVLADLALLLVLLAEMWAPRLVPSRAAAPAR
ncbi:low temperature requirement protein A [Micromonospora sp. NPDC049366]|uniref:low temperature requirement protein A n=1 Tax=Micromonospora sp. NPDC049366 TaxID=3364271 RepID=UPI003788EE16